jgi:undecaprenyl-diphosphatase
MGNLDTVLFDLINRSWSSPFLDHFMPLISSLDVWKPFMFAGALWVLILGGKSGRLFLLSVAIGLLLGDVILSHALKHVFARPRPRDIRVGVIVRSLSPGEPKLFHVFEPPNVVVSEPSTDLVRHGNSFPSSHVINFFMFATVAFRFRRRAGFLLGLVGIAVAWSRIYCGAHWPSDIPPSVLIGVFSGFVAHHFADLIFRLLAKTNREESAPNPT